MKYDEKGAIHGQLSMAEAREKGHLTRSIMVELARNQEGNFVHQTSDNNVWSCRGCSDLEKMHKQIVAYNLINLGNDCLLTQKDIYVRLYIFIRVYIVIYNISHPHYNFESELNIIMIKIIYLRFALLRIKTIHTIINGVN